jgi:methyl-accepting chemotaxis protein
VNEVLGKYSVSTSVLIFILVVLITVSSLIAVGIAFVNKSDAYMDQIAKERLINLRNSRSQILSNFLQSNANIIGQFSSAQAVINGLIDFKDGLPSAADDVMKSSGERNALLLEAQGKVNSFYMDSYLKTYQEYDPGSKSILKFIPKHQDGILLQDAFIVNNKNPINDRFKLLSSEVTPTYSIFHEKYHPTFVDFIEKHGFYDALLLDAEQGKVVYSTLKEADFGQSIAESALENTALLKAFEKAKKLNVGEAVFVDFSFYTPSLGKPIAFWASPIFLDKNLLGILIIKIQTNQISNVITNNFSFKDDGLGKSGEVLVIGEDGLLRNDSRESFENVENYYEILKVGNDPKLAAMYLKLNSNAMLQLNKSFAFHEGVQGIKSVTTFTSVEEHRVIGAYGPFKFGDLHWIISAELDESEARSLSTELRHYVAMSILIIVIILIPLSYLVASLFLRPFHRLIDTIQRIYQTHNLKLRLNGRFTTEVNSLIESFNLMLEQLQKDEEIITTAKQNIEDSIAVANRVLVSKLPTKDDFDALFSASAIAWKPRDIVGGDVYWLKDFGGRIYLACIDSTGHGVPGSFIAMMALSSFERIPHTTYERLELHEVVNAIHKNFQKQFTRLNDVSVFKDGFALSLLCLDKNNETITFLGMGQDALVKQSDGTVSVLKGNRKSIGYGNQLSELKLLAHQRVWDKEDSYFLYTDGLTTQVGGARKKMMGTAYVVEQLKTIPGNAPVSLVEGVFESFEAWRGSVEVRDDLTIIAVKPN